MAVETQTFEHVLVVGAEARGYAPQSSTSASGARVGLVWKSLLGKAHTVMAEGGVAAALANVTLPGQLARPLRGHDARRAVPQQLAHGRAHAKEAPDRVRELRRGRGLRPHQDGASSSAISAATSTAPRAHVGDRTGLR